VIKGVDAVSISPVNDISTVLADERDNLSFPIPPSTEQVAEDDIISIASDTGAAGASSTDEYQQEWQNDDDNCHDDTEVNLDCEESLSDREGYQVDFELLTSDTVTREAAFSIKTDVPQPITDHLVEATHLILKNNSRLSPLHTVEQHSEDTSLYDSLLEQGQLHEHIQRAHSDPHPPSDSSSTSSLNQVSLYCLLIYHFTLPVFASSIFSQKITCGIIPLFSSV
jgi:hypothetical protein